MYLIGQVFELHFVSSIFGCASCKRVLGLGCTILASMLCLLSALRISLSILLLIDKRNAERELVSRPFVRFCPQVSALRAFNLLDHVGGVSVVNQLGYHRIGGASDVFHTAVCFGVLQLTLYNGDLR